MAQAQIKTCYWHLTKFTFAPPSIRPKLSIILHLPLSLFRKFPPTLLFNWNWKLEYGIKLLLRRYSRVSDLNISKDQRKKHWPYYKRFYWPFQGGTSFVDLVFSVLCWLCLTAFVRICLFVPCGHLLGKGWPLGSRLWCITEFVTFP